MPPTTTSPLFMALPVIDPSLQERLENIASLAKQSEGSGFIVTPAACRHITLHRLGRSLAPLKEILTTARSFHQRTPVPQEPLVFDRISSFDKGALVVTMADSDVPDVWHEYGKGWKQALRPYTIPGEIEWSLRPHITIGYRSLGRKLEGGEAYILISPLMTLQAQTLTPTLYRSTGRQELPYEAIGTVL